VDDAELAPGPKPTAAVSVPAEGEGALYEGKVGPVLGKGLADGW
jgi:hypothetical protein